MFKNSEVVKTTLRFSGRGKWQQHCTNTSLSTCGQFGQEVKLPDMADSPTLE